MGAAHSKRRSTLSQGSSIKLLEGFSVTNRPTFGPTIRFEQSRCVHSRHQGTMAQYYQPPPQQHNPYGQSSNAQNLQFYPSSYTSQPVSGHSTPFQAYNNAGSQSYGNTGFSGASSGFAGPSSGFGGFSGVSGVSGRMGDQGGLRTGWLAAFGTEGYDGEPPLLEELGVNFGHIKTKVWCVYLDSSHDHRKTASSSEEATENNGAGQEFVMNKTNACLFGRLSLYSILLLG